MEELCTRKCDKCKEIITIEKKNISNVLIFEGKYYHSKCFVEFAEECATSKRRKPEKWRNALEKVPQLEVETKTKLEWRFNRDDLIDWLLNHYNIRVVPTQFWKTVTDLERGIYKKQQCNPIDMGMLLDVWKWAQNKLDIIAVGNKTNHKGPENDGARLMYDLAIVVQEVPNFFTCQRTTQILESEHNENVFLTYTEIKSKIKKDIYEDKRMTMIPPNMLYMKSGIYGIYVEGVCVYIGKSTNLFERIKEHEFMIVNFDRIDTNIGTNKKYKILHSVHNIIPYAIYVKPILVQIEYNEEELSILESIYIKKYLPYFNIAIPNDNGSIDCYTTYSESVDDFAKWVWDHGAYNVQNEPWAKLNDLSEQCEDYDFELPT